MAKKVGERAQAIECFRMSRRTRRSGMQARRVEIEKERGGTTEREKGGKEINSCVDLFSSSSFEAMLSSLAANLFYFSLLSCSSPLSRSRYTLLLP